MVTFSTSMGGKVQNLISLSSYISCSIFSQRLNFRIENAVFYIILPMDVEPKTHELFLSRSEIPRSAPHTLPPFQIAPCTKTNPNWIRTRNISKGKKKVSWEVAIPKIKRLPPQSKEKEKFNSRARPSLLIISFAKPMRPRELLLIKLLWQGFEKKKKKRGWNLRYYAQRILTVAFKNNNFRTVLEPEGPFCVYLGYFHQTTTDNKLEGDYQYLQKSFTPSLGWSSFRCLKEGKFMLTMDGKGLVVRGSVSCRLIVYCGSGYGQARGELWPKVR